MYAQWGGGVDGYLYAYTALRCMHAAQFNSKRLVMATAVPLFSLVNATSFSNCSEDIVEESCVVHQANVN